MGGCLFWYEKIFLKNSKKVLTNGGGIAIITLAFKDSRLHPGVEDLPRMQ
jgi:hypothetical protein